MVSKTVDTQIPVSSEMRDRLRGAKQGGERYEDLLQRLLKEYDPDRVGRAAGGVAENAAYQEN